MTRPAVRRAGPADARALAELLNAVIAQGGTTALTAPVSRAQIAAWMAADPRAIWHLAEDDKGEVLGFQWVEPHPEFGSDCAQIATFARVGHTGLGIGSALFEATRAAARRGGYRWINAEIRADNAGGLIYYQSRGFEGFALRRAVRLDDGTVVDKILKRHEL